MDARWDDCLRTQGSALRTISFLDGLGRRSALLSADSIRDNTAQLTSSRQTKESSTVRRCLARPRVSFQASPCRRVDILPFTEVHRMRDLPDWRLPTEDFVT